LFIMGSQSRDARAAVPEPGDLFGVRLSGEEHYMDSLPTVGQRRGDSLHELSLNEREIAQLGYGNGVGAPAL
jgi:hypothetical protein